MALSPYMMRMMGSQMGGIAPGTISGLTQPMTLGVPAVQPLMGMAAMPAGPSYSLPKMSAGAPEVDVNDLLKQMASNREVIANRNAKALENAGSYEGLELPPQVKEVLDRQAARIAAQRAEVEREGKSSVWDKLGSFSAGLLENQSPFFSVGLGRAVNSMLNEEQARRATLAQRRAQLGEREERMDTAKMQQFEAVRSERIQRARDLIAARRDAGQEVSQDMAMAEKAIGLANSNTELQRAETLFNLTVQGKKSDLATDVARRAEIASTIEDKRERRARDFSGGAGSVEARADRQELDKAVADYAAADSAYILALAAANGDPNNISDPEIAAKRNMARARALQFSKTFNLRYGQTPYPFKGEATGQKAVRPVASTTGSVIDFSKLNPR